MAVDQLDRIFRHSRVALDTNIFIYALEENPNFPHISELFRRLVASKAEVFTSIVSVLESVVPLFKLGEEQRIPDYLDFIHGQGRITVANIDRSIALKAAELRAKYSLKTPDAIQIATALIHNMEVFVTADRDYKVDTIENLRIEVVQPVKIPKS